jgi:hypothetical protein
MTLETDNSSFSVHMSLYGQRLFEAKVTLRARARCDAGIQEVFKLQWEEPESSGALFQDEQIIAILSLENLVNSTPDGSCRIATRGLLSMSSKVFSGWKVTVGESAEVSLGPRRWWFGSNRLP